jgi:mannose/fructose/sorbose-specific phosphotransferase system IIA component
MIGIVVAGHGSFGDGLRDGAQMIMGPQEQLAIVELRPAENLDVYRDRLQQAVKEVESGEGVLVIVDLFGGSPSNVSAYLVGETVEVVAGASLPMLIEVLSARDDADLGELVKTALSAGQQGLVRLADKLGGGAA